GPPDDHPPGPPPPRRDKPVASRCSWRCEPPTSSSSMTKAIVGCVALWVFITSFPGSGRRAFVRVPVHPHGPGRLFPPEEVHRVGGERGAPAQVVLVPHGEDQQQPQLFAVGDAPRA